MDDCSVSFARSNQPIDLSVGQTIQRLSRASALNAEAVFVSVQDFHKCRALFAAFAILLDARIWFENFILSQLSQHASQYGVGNSEFISDDKGLICRNFVNVRQKPTKYFGVPRAQALHMGV